MKKDTYVKKINEFRDIRGSLLPLQFDELSFLPKRIFFVKDVPKDVIRGEHAHYVTKQLLICVTGKILVGLFDGKSEKEFIIQSGESIMIENMIWQY